LPNMNDSCEKKPILVEPSPESKRPCFDFIQLQTWDVAESEKFQVEIDINNMLRKVYLDQGFVNVRGVLRTPDPLMLLFNSILREYCGIKLLPEFLELINR
jgi:hypothetical protein